jgi:hypothetical protein
MPHDTQLSTNAAFFSRASPTSRFLCEKWEPQTISAIRFAAMPHAANLDGVGIWADEEEAVVAYTQRKFVSSSESFHVIDARLCETVKY